MQIKAKIDDGEKNSNHRLCADRDEIVNHIVCECSKLAQKEYKTGWERWSTWNCETD